MHIVDYLALFAVAFGVVELIVFTVLLIASDET